MGSGEAGKRGGRTGGIAFTMRIAAFALILLVVLKSVASGQSIHVEPRVATMDQPIALHIVGLPPGQRGTVRASSVEKSGRLWVSMRDVSIGDSVVDASELLTSMTVRGEETPQSRFDVSWRDTVVTVFSLNLGNRTIATDTLRRTFGPSDVSARQLNENGIVGTLFEHRDGRKRPAILVLGGSEGGDGAADVAYQLSDYGYNTLSLAYFGVEPLPQQLESIPLEYFISALNYLRALPSSRAKRVGIVATSKGAEAALVVATLDTGIAAVVAYAPSSVAWSCICDSTARSSWSFRGKDIQSVPLGRDPNYTQAPPIRPAANYSYRLQRTTGDQGIIDVSRITAPVYLIAGGDDGLWPSAQMARDIYRKLSLRSLHAGSRLDIYPGAGHLIGKSLLPSGSTLLARGRIDTGGTPSANAAAGRDAWPRVVAFLDRALKK